MLLLQFDPGRGLGTRVRRVRAGPVWHLTVGQGGSNPCSELAVPQCTWLTAQGQPLNPPSTKCGGMEVVISSGIIYGPLGGGEGL